MRLLPLALDNVPKLDPDPVAAPDKNGVEKFVAAEEGVVPNSVLENAGVEVEEGANNDVCGEAPGPNNVFAGVEAMGVENIEDDDVAIAGVLKSEEPLAAELLAMPADVCGAVDVPGVAELDSSPVT